MGHVAVKSPFGGLGGAEDLGGEHRTNGCSYEACKDKLTDKLIFTKSPFGVWAAREGAIPTIFQDLPLAATLGSLIALSAHRQLMNADSALGNRWFRDAVIFGFLIFMPVGIFFYLQWPDWSWLYTYNPRNMGSWIQIAVWSAYPLAVCLGFAVVAVFVRGDSPRFALAIPALFGLILLVVSGFGFDRFIHLASYEDFAIYVNRPRAVLPFVWGDQTWLLAMAGTGIFVGIPFAYLAARNLKEGGAGLLPPLKP